MNIEKGRAVEMKHKKTWFLVGIVLILFLAIDVGMLIRIKSQENEHKAENQVQVENKETRKDSVSDVTSSPDLVPDITTTPEPTMEPIPITTQPMLKESAYENITLSFAGDILLADDSVPINAYENRGKGLAGIFSKKLLQMMQKTDVMMLNNEFAFSTRGEKTKGKQYNFRANPKRVEILKKMGVDIVSLANNHALDYGKNALLDTFKTLDHAGIDYVGAGANMKRAEKVIYKKVGGRTIGYVSAAKTLLNTSWVAANNHPGMVPCWEEARLKGMIKTAKENSDYVVVFVHWGVEQKEYPEEYQKNWARMYIDEGADIVLGCHPHVVQGIEVYKGKPIIYSLGNFWFSSYGRKSMLIQTVIKENGKISTYVVPCYTKDCYTYIIEKKEERIKYFESINQLSPQNVIGKDGLIKLKS